jgi:hypothetical protein
MTKIQKINSEYGKKLQKEEQKFRIKKIKLKEWLKNELDKICKHENCRWEDDSIYDERTLVCLDCKCKIKTERNCTGYDG